MYKLIAERMTELQIDEINTTSIARGREIEPLARNAVIKKTGINFIETGMLVDGGLTGFAISPELMQDCKNPIS